MKWTPTDDTRMDGVKYLAALFLVVSILALVTVAVSDTAEAQSLTLTGPA